MSDGVEARSDRERRGLEAAAAVVAVGGATAWSQPSVAGSDLWWHLASGREIVTNLAIPSQDIFSHTFAGEPWTNHEWLWDVIYWGAYSVHPEAVAWLNLGVVVTALALVYVLARRESDSRLAAGAVVWLVAAASHWFIDIRPHLFTLNLVGLVLLTRDRTWAPWLWPPLMFVWANLHAGFTFGLGVIGLVALARTADLCFEARRLVVPWRVWAGVAGAILAMLAQPSGIGILSYPAAYLDANTPYRGLVEWLATPFSLDLATFAGRFWLLAGVVTLGMPLAAGRLDTRRLAALRVWAPWLLAALFLALPIATALTGLGGSSWPGLLFALMALGAAARGHRLLPALALVTLAMGTTSRRFIPLFGVTAAPIAAIALAWGLAQARLMLPALRSRLAELATAGLALALAVWLWSGVRLAPALLYRWTDSSFYPEAALTYLSLLGTPERLLNLYNWGGYIMLHAPQIPVYIDGRANTLYDDDLYREYQQLQSNGGDAFRAIVARRRFDAVLFPRSSLPVQILQSDPNWRLVYLDSLAAILVRNGTPIAEGPFPDISALMATSPHLELERAAQLYTRGNSEAAKAQLEDLLERQPFFAPGYGRLARMHALDGNMEEAHATIRRGLCAVPRSSDRLYELEGLAYQVAGDLPRAIEALKRGRPGGPFRSPAMIDSLIARLEAQWQAQLSRGEPSGGSGATPEDRDE